MKRGICTVLLLAPAIVFLRTHVWWLGIVLIGLIIVDYITGKRLIIPACKVMYFMVYVPVLVFGLWRERRRQRKFAKRNTIWYDVWWY